MRKNLRYSSWIERHVTEVISRHYSKKTLDIYDIWLIMNILYEGKPLYGMTIERKNEKIYFTLDVPVVSQGIYNPEKGTFTTKFEQDPYHRLTLRSITIEIPTGIQELKVKRKYKWLITKRKIITWGYAQHFKPNLYIQGRIWSTDGVKGWLERTPKGFAYVGILGTITSIPKGSFFEEEAVIVQGEFRGEEIPLIANNTHSPQIPPRKVVEALGLKEGL